MKPELSRAIEQRDELLAVKDSVDSGLLMGLADVEAEIAILREDERDIEIAKTRLAEIEADPGCLIRIDGDFPI